MGPPAAAPPGRALPAGAPAAHPEVAAADPVAPAGHRGATAGHPEVAAAQPGATAGYPAATAGHPGALAGPPVDWAAVRRLLVVRPDNLGDVLLAGPALRALRAAAPAAHLTLLASPGGAPAAGLLPEVDEVLLHSPIWQLAGPAPPPDPAAELALVGRLRGYEVAVVLTSFSQSPWPAATLLHLAGVPVRIGLSKEFGGALLTHWVPAPHDALHQVDRALHLLAAVGVPSQGTRLHARIPAGRAPGPPYALVLPGASCSARRWPAGRFRQVVAGLRAGGLQVRVVGAPAERELLEQVDDAPVSDLSVRELAQLLAGACVAVVNNSGGMHLADALGVPQVVLFAGTEQLEQYAPRSSAAVVLNRPTPCAPCRAFHCPYEQQCLDIEPATVVQAALGLLRAAA